VLAAGGVAAGCGVVKLAAFVFWSVAVERTQGKVKWFNDVKGFGFISGEGGQDIFVHHTAIVAEGYRSLKEGEVVEYDLETGPKGLKAVNVRKAEAAQPVIA
jgi:cold shock protein